MANQHNVFITKDWVILKENSLQVYNDTRRNFIKDYGKDVSFETADYNPDVNVYGCCVINDEILEEGEVNAECEDIIASLATIIYNKNKRLTKERSIDDYKALKLAELKEARDKAEQQPITTDKGSFDVDDKSITRITNAILILEKMGSTLDWTLADNTVVVVTADDLQNVMFALGEQSNAAHEKHRDLKAQVEACKTVDEVEAIVW